MEVNLYLSMLDTAQLQSDKTEVRSGSWTTQEAMDLYRVDQWGSGYFGINEQGHMTLHARTVAQAAGAPPDIFNEVITQLIQSGEIKVWKAQEIIEKMKTRKRAPKPKTTVVQSTPGQSMSAGYGKVILFGEQINRTLSLN